MSTSLDWLKRPIAHRGLHNAANGVIENTPTAFRLALEAGYAIEADVRASSDGEVMVFHDAVLDRLTDVKGDVAAQTARDLRKIPFSRTADRMQTLPELLEQVAGRAPLVIEVKTDWIHRGPLEKRIAELLRGYDGHVAVMSFDPHSVAAFAETAPGMPRGLVAETFTDSMHWPELNSWQRFAMRHLLSAFIARPHFIAYDIRALPAVAPLAARCLSGRPLLAWTVRTPRQRRTAERWADAMIFEGFRP